MRRQSHKLVGLLLIALRLPLPWLVEGEQFDLVRGLGMLLLVLLLGTCLFL